MTNVTISGNKGNDRGGGISNNGTLTMTDCTVTGNTSLDATDPAGGGGIFNYNGKEATLTNCTITGNTASTYAGGGICNYGTMTLNNCSLSGNNANTTGGGIFCSTTSTLNINGCEITGNIAGGYGDGIYIDNSTLNMQGLCTVTGNNDGNIYLYGSGTKITVTGAFTTGSNIGVGVTDYGRKLTSGYSTYNSGHEPGEFFSMDNAAYAIGEKDGEVYPGVPYWDHSWEGGNTDGHVVYTQKVCTDYSNYSDTEDLNTGWYVLSGSHTYEKRPRCHGDVKFILQDGSDAEFKKGIHIDDGKTLTIYAQSGGTGKITCSGYDKSDASIGGNSDSMAGHLVIHGGTIEAETTRHNGAGIGGGGGENSGMRSITIWDGNVSGTARYYGAGIGGGKNNNTVPTINIYGGTVNAHGGGNSAGIGGAVNRSNSTIKIYGGNVTATGGGYGAGIGGGDEKSVTSSIYIYGGTVNATGGYNGAGIGSGNDGNLNAPIYIYSGNITAEGGDYGAGIGGGDNGHVNASIYIYIYNGTINSSGGKYGSGIGGGSCGDLNAPLYIYSGTVDATGGSYGAGIGGGSTKGLKASVNIYGGTVTARGTNESAGIGGGQTGDGGPVNIYGGSVYVNGYYSGAAIGGGERGNGGNVTIKDGYIYLFIESADYSTPYIGCGKRTSGSSSDNGSLDLASNMKVTRNGSTVNASERIDILTSTQTTNNVSCTIEVCDHIGAICEEYDDYYHHYKCSYCDGYLEAHTLGSNGKCTLCGRTLPERALTFYEANASGTGYDSGVSYYFNEGISFTLPECSSVPDKMVFAGWKQADSAPSLLTVENSTGLLQAGETVTVGTSDCNYYALYMFTDIRGKGTEGDPYLISSIDEFNRLAYTVNHGVTLTGKYFRLDADLDFTGETFTPIGDEKHQFKGSFYGNGHIISGVTATSGTYQGIIGHLGMGGVVEACVSNCVSIVGTNDGGTITNCLRLGDTNYLFSTSGSTIGYSVESGTERLTLDYGSATASYGDRSLEVYSFDQGNDQTARGLLYDGKFYTGSETTVTFAAEANANIRHLFANGTELTNIGDNKYQMIMGSENVTITAELDNFYVLLYDGQSNSTTITAHDDHIADVTISERTLYKDGNWNTLCLPFNVSTSQMGNYNCPLYGATVMELDVDGKYDASGNIDADGTYSTGFDDGTLYLYFQEVDEIEAGVPYLIKWAAATPNYFENPGFNSVEIEASDPENVESADGKVSFIGCYDPVNLPINDKSNLFLGVDNENKSTLYYPSDANNDDGNYYVNAFRAYFHVDLSTSPSGVGGAIRAFSLHFGDDAEQTGIKDIENGRLKIENESDAVYDLQGRRMSSSIFNLQSSMLKKGLYIYNGKKVVIK